jgi:hypothetical protein
MTKTLIFDMDSDEDARMSDSETQIMLSKGKGKAVELDTPDSESLPWYGCNILRGIRLTSAGWRSIDP